MKNFPTRARVGMLLGAVLGLLSIIPAFAVWHHYERPLERFYFPQYIGSTPAETPVARVISFCYSRRSTRIYFVVIQGAQPATDTTALNPASDVSLRFLSTTPRIFSLWLQNHVYSGRELRAALEAEPALWAGIGSSLFLCGLCSDFGRRKGAREGVQLRGPDLLSRGDFNRASKGHGFTLHVQIKLLRIRRRDESKHFLTIGHRGVGNSQFIKQLLYYARECRDSCIVLDSKLEFMAESTWSVLKKQVGRPQSSRKITRK